MSNALSSRRGLLRRPKVCKPGPPHEIPIVCPTTSDCANLNPAALQYTFTFVGLSAGFCADCGRLNGPKILNHSAFCNWTIDIPAVCFTDIQVTFSIGITEADLLLFLTPMFTVTYRGPRPTSLMNGALLTKLGGTDFCTGFPPTIIVSPVCV